MDTWFTSDHHFGHKNIITYCDRPFASVAEMNEGLVAAWNSCVQPDDLVYYLGDFSLSPSIMEQYVSRLNGKKILICGNHDACHPCNHNGKMVGSTRYKQHFEAVYTEHEWGDLLLHHMPYHDEHDHRYPEYRPFDQGKVLLHGHVHQRWTTNGRQINVGVDVWDYLPVHEDQIKALVKQVEEETLQEWTEELQLP